MTEVDIHYGKPTVETALESLKFHLKSSKSRRENVLTVVVGYGSTGGTHRIKNATIDYLDSLINLNQIKGFICGNELDIFNSKYQNFRYKDLIPDSEKRKMNPGVIYIIL